MTAPLKPCPFCGGEARYQADHTTDCHDSIWCGFCDFGMFDPDEQGSVVTAWNRRADAPELAALRDAADGLSHAGDILRAWDAETIQHQGAGRVAEVMTDLANRCDALGAALAAYEAMK